MRNLLALAILSPLALAGCDRKHCHDPQPEPACYAGTIVGSTCMDGVLIDVDPRYPIGSPALLPRYGRPDTLLGANVIAVVNSSALSGHLPIPAPGQPGQQLHFTAINDPNQQWNGLCCFANDGVKTPIPRLVLSNLSTTPCQPNVLHPLNH
jgi:hypothetical protein